jgi:hypothetical protein
MIKLAPQFGYLQPRQVLARRLCDEMIRVQDQVNRFRTESSHYLSTGQWEAILQPETKKTSLFLEVVEAKRQREHEYYEDNYRNPQRKQIPELPSPYLKAREWLIREYDKDLLGEKSIAKAEKSKDRKKTSAAEGILMTLENCSDQADPRRVWELFGDVYQNPKLINLVKEAIDKFYPPIQKGR